MRTTPDRFMASLPLPEVYRVGGSVRDELLGRESKDSDYVVRGATLGEIESAIAYAGGKPAALKLRDGRQAGVRAHIREIGLLEIVLPRTEVSTGAGHRDFEIITDPALPLDVDAERRDFTINALYRDVRTGRVIDPLKRGLSDLDSRRIAITHPDSFRDDPLRTLRALRFVSRLPDFELDDDTRAAMSLHAEFVTGLSAKGYPSGTVLDEFSRLLMGSRPARALRLARDTGVLAVAIPEIAPMLGYEQRSRYHDKTTDEHTFDAIQAAAHMRRDHAPLRVRWALLFHDAGKPLMAWRGEDGYDHYYAHPAGGAPHEGVGAKIAYDALTRLNAPRKLRDDVVTLVERHMLPVHDNIKPFKVRKWRAELGDDLLRDLITHRLCDALGKGGDVAEQLEFLSWVEDVRWNAQRAKVPTSVKGLAIGGRDMIELGLEGPAIGEVQRQLLHEVLANPKLNNREWLLRRAQSVAPSEEHPS